MKIGIKEKKILEELYKQGKKISTPPVFTAMNLRLSGILEKINLSLDEAKPSLDNLVGFNFIVWDRELIMLKDDGLRYCMDELDRPSIGF